VHDGLAEDDGVIESNVSERGIENGLKTLRNRVSVLIIWTINESIHGAMTRKKWLVGFPYV
jgi:hypothetical protein